MMITATTAPIIAKSLRVIMEPDDVVLEEVVLDPVECVADVEDVGVVLVVIADSGWTKSRVPQYSWSISPSLKENAPVWSVGLPQKYALFQL